ncbi:MAG: hypothetical protein C4340_07035 [Armatimonadota bacterium]
MRKSWILLAILALVLAGFAVFAIAQNSPTKAQDGATPTPSAQDPLAGNVFDQRVSAEFQEATLAEVLRWLASTGVNFVADPTSAGDAKVTLSVKDVPLRDLLRAIEQVFHGTWTKNGEVYAFKAKARSRLEGAWPDAPRFNNEEWRKWMEEFGRRLPDVAGPDQVEEFLRRFREALPPEFRRFERFGPGSPRFFRFDTPDIGRLFESITDEQWRKHDQKGYLTPDDLTEEQRAMLGQADGTFSITLSVNGRTLNLRSR